MSEAPEKARGTSDWLSRREFLKGAGIVVGGMNNPADLNNLVSPIYYAYLRSEGWTGPVPPMH